jgi:hypothetical protein
MEIPLITWKKSCQSGRNLPTTGEGNAIQEIIDGQTKLIEELMKKMEEKKEIKSTLKETV